MDERQRRVDPARYREVMGHYPTGVVVVSGTNPEGEPIGMVVGTFTSVSLDPPLVAFMPSAESHTYALMRDSPAYCINVLAHDQLDLCHALARPRKGMFEEVDWSPSPLGVPMLADAVAHVHCRPVQVVSAGDHVIVVCEGLDMHVTRPVNPLLFFQGAFGGFNPRGMTAHGDASLIEAVRLAEVARPHVERFAAEFACECGVLVPVSDSELTVAASAYGGRAQMRESLGLRVPMTPPLGEGLVAWQSPHQIENWLRREPSGDPKTAERYRRRLALIREHGYSVAGLPAGSPPLYDRMQQAMAQYATGSLLPAHERAVRAVIADSQDLFEMVDVADEQRYDMASIVVPVRLGDGRVPMILRATQLPQDVDGLTVRGWIRALRATVARVGADLGAGVASS